MLTDGSLVTSAVIGGYGATAARLTPDQKVGSSNLSGLTFAACCWLPWRPCPDLGGHVLTRIFKAGPLATSSGLWRNGSARCLLPWRLRQDLGGHISTHIPEAVLPVTL